MLIIDQIWPAVDWMWRVIVNWWWLPGFFFFYKKLVYYWKWWRGELWFNTVYKPLTMEITIPKEILKPTKAMEAVFVALHGATYNPPDFWEEYVTGEPQVSYHLEIASIDGRIHFYIRVHQEFRNQVEAAIYSQYPEAEIQVVPDYTKQVPLDIPNNEWEMFGFDYKMRKIPQFPIPTYEVFETEGAKEEEKVDPFASLMESLSKLKPGEQVWLLIRARPKYHETGGAAFVKKAEHLRDVLAKRVDEIKPNTTPIWKDVLNFILHGAPEKEEKGPELFPAEMRLTTGEREAIDAVEKKMTKPLFDCFIRTIYLAKKDVWYKPNFRLIYNYFNYFSNPDINSLEIWGRTMTRIKKSAWIWMHLIQTRREYVKKRHLLRTYRERLNYDNPWFSHDDGAKIVLNTEELATLYHFPSVQAAPTPGIKRTEAKETTAPYNLPI